MSEHPTPALLPDLPTREQIEAFEALMFAHVAEHGGEGDITTRHFHADEIYGRAIDIPAGTVLIGTAHKADHLNVCVGDITVWTEEGLRRLTGTNILSSRAGAKRVGFAHADTMWLSIHRNATGGTDVQAIEEALVERADMLMTRRAAIGTDTRKALE